MTKQQFTIAVLYSSFFPLCAILYKPLADVALFINAPFLPIGWIGGMAMVSLFHTESVYPIGLFLTIFIQVLFVIKHFNLFSKNYSYKPVIFIFIFLIIIVFLAFPNFKV